MSLIQQALEKTSRVQETRTANPSPAPKVYERDPMGAALEQELTQVQQSYARRRKFYWKISLGVLAVFFVAGLSYVGIRSSHSVAKVSSGTVTSHAPLRIFSGTLYRLTGITSADGKSMAVINDQIVSVGDPLSGKAMVKAIGNGEVRLDVQGREIKLTL
ncbi:MAG: hypothetical protein WC133_01210 [Candidatus Omnitrophota bacterium]